MILLEDSIHNQQYNVTGAFIWYCLVTTTRTADTSIPMSSVLPHNHSYMHAHKTTETWYLNNYTSIADETRSIKFPSLRRTKLSIYLPGGRLRSAATTGLEAIFTVWPWQKLGAVEPQPKTEKSGFTAQPADGILRFLPCVLRPTVRTPVPGYGPNGHQEGDKCPVWTGNWLRKAVNSSKSR